jgi:hypothetical protein
LGAFLEAGIQIKITDRFTIPIMVNFNYGCTDIKSHNAQYSNGIMQDFYWTDKTHPFHNPDPNKNNSFHNFAFGLQFGLMVNVCAVKK